MMQCPSCRQEIGMNRTCRDCMGHMTREGAKRLDGAKIREIAAQGRAWLAARGTDAPPELREKTGRLLSFLEPRIAGGAEVPPGDPAALAAFAVHYVVSPQDLAPDSIPSVGWSDDLLVAEVALEAVAPPAGAPEAGKAKARKGRGGGRRA